MTTGAVGSGLLGVPAEALGRTLTQHLCFATKPESPLVEYEATTMMAEGHVFWEKMRHTDLKLLKGLSD